MQTWNKKDQNGEPINDELEASSSDDKSDNKSDNEPSNEIDNESDNA